MILWPAVETWAAWERRAGRPDLGRIARLDGKLVALATMLERYLAVCRQVSQ